MCYRLSLPQGRRRPRRMDKPTFEVRGGTFGENLWVSWPLRRMRVWPGMIEIDGLEIFRLGKIQIPKENIDLIRLSGSWNAWLPANGLWISWNGQRRRSISFFPLKPRQLARRLASSGYPVSGCQRPCAGALRRTLSTRAGALSVSFIVFAGLMTALGIWPHWTTSLSVATLPVWLLCLFYLYRYLRDM
jgi:hypothetical protein